MVDEQLQAAADASEALGCVLCGRPSEYVGVFVPDHGSDYGVAPGSRFVYRICEDHLADWQGVKARIERHIWKNEVARLRKIGQ